MTDILSFTTARHLVEEHARGLKPHVNERLALLDARGRVLAETIVADRDFPPFARATRDGYAVRADDVRSVPVTLKVVGELRAGGTPESISRELGFGDCVEIMTGAPVPAGLDAVVMVEYTHRQSATRVEIQRSITTGENVVPRGAEARAGDSLLVPGIRLGHAAVGLAASVGQKEISVYAKPRVAVLSTGDEVVDIAALPGPYQIRNSNTYSLAAHIAAAGAEAILLPVAPDDCSELHRLVALGFRADLLLLTGGVSMGKYDLVEEVLAEFNAEFVFTSVAIQPGKPVVFGRVPSVDPARGGQAGSTYFFGLPGNPVSTMVTFALFVHPILDALAGAAPQPLRWLQARLKSDFRIKTGLTRFLPATITGEFERCEVEPLEWHGSGDIAATARANCYLVVPPDRDHIKAGETVSVMLKE